jgi:AraC-like DNA-binding protein
MLNLVPSPALSIARFSEFDAFKPAEFGAAARSVPLDIANFYAARATLQLPSCQITALRSFARIIDASYRIDGGLVMISLEDIEPVSAKGMTLDSRSFVAMRGRIDNQFCEPRPTVHALIALATDLPDRGWFETPGRLCAFSADKDAQANARRILRDLLLTASAEPHLFQEPGLALGMREDLLMAIDDMFRESRPSTSHRMANGRYRGIVRKVDKYVALHATSAIYSADLAAQCGVPVRTLATAVTNVRGTNLHRYLRLKQIWAIRAQLMKGSDAITVASCARANGFHHMGEFAAPIAPPSTRRPRARWPAPEALADCCHNVASPCDLSGSAILCNCRRTVRGPHLFSLESIR